VTKSGKIIYHYNRGEKNDNLEPINNETVVRIASLSKSFASVAFMQLVETGAVALNSTLSQVLGFEISNPHYPEVPLTFEMVMSHQSSIVDCDPAYINFLYATRAAKSGGRIPNIRELLHRDG
jgi:CubicO group peptidase (beta-lactamase class C family)